MLLLSGLLACVDAPSTTVELPEGRIDAHGFQSDAGLSLRFAAWGRPGAVEMTGPVHPVADAGRFERDFGALVEWWVPLDGALEQGWTVLEAPSGSGPLWIEVAVEGEVLRVEHTAALLADGDGARWDYRDLRAWDALGDALPATMEATPTGLRIVVDDRGALYPLTVDPTISQNGEDKLVASDAATNDHFGYAVAGAGDINRDGYQDVVAGAVGVDSGSAWSVGAAYVYYGSASGIDVTSEEQLFASDLAQSGWFGRSVAGAGDTNCDGVDDLIIGADGMGTFYRGAAYVIQGGSAGLSGSYTEDILTASNAANYDRYGAHVAGAGDLDQDGCHEVMVYGSGTETVYLYHGASTGIALGTEVMVEASDGVAGDEFGQDMDGIGDVDADGYPDIAVGAPEDDESASNSGSVYVFYGASSGLSLASEERVNAASPVADDEFGVAVAGAGDVDGDGYDDLVVGALFANTDLGGAYVYYGSASGLGGEDALVASDGAQIDYAGVAVSGGDLDQDGYSDVVMGAGFHGNAGAVYVYYGSSTGVLQSSEEKVAASDGAASDYFGGALDILGDGNGDGFLDLLVGAGRDDDNGSSSGSAYVYYGGCPDWYSDSDGDGYGDAASSTTSCTQPSGYVDDDTDCDDTDASVNPAASEVCDAANVDEDCSGDADDADSNATGQTSWYTDSDGDGYGDPSSSVSLCDQPSGTSASSDDSDDSDSGIHIAAQEVCDTSDVDEDCDGDADDADSSATGQTTWYSDSDGDGFGDPNNSTALCEQPTATTTDSTDCDDTDSAINTAAQEVCDSSNVDEDCDGVADDGDSSATGQSTWYSDSDGDGYGDVSSSSSACDQPSGSVSDGTDCDDASSGVNPGASEVCDVSNVDEDCDGVADDADSSATGQSTWYSDGDGDGYGDSGSSSELCDQPEDTTSDATDCDDGDADVDPGAVEVCDSSSVDEDCDGLVDDQDDSVTGQSTWYADSDGDGHGDPNVSSQACEASGAVANADDCDDDDGDVHPDAQEVCDPADTDEDCDGDADDDDDDVLGQTSWYPDEDGDGYGVDDLVTSCDEPEASADGGGDCDDAAGDVHPDADEVCGDGVDNDCSGGDEDCADSGDAVDTGGGGGGKTCGTTSGGSTSLLFLLALVSLRRRPPWY